MFLFLTITLSLVITIFSFIHLPLSSYADNEKYLNCSAPFDCAGIEGLNYPFWGSNRPNYCGHPAFELNCREDAPLIKITNSSYRILEVNNVSRTLKVIKQDSGSSAVCRSTGFNNIAINFTFFDYDSATTNLTLYYNCSNSFPFLPHTTRFECSVDRTYTYSTNNYCLNSTIANLHSNSLEGLCKFNVTVPILQSAAQTGSNLTEAGLIQITVCVMDVKPPVGSVGTTQSRANSNVLYQQQVRI
jgi:archaellin